LRVRRCADRDEHGVGADGCAVGEAHASGPAVRGSDAGDLGVEAEVDAVLAVQGGEYLSGLGAEHPQQGRGRGLDDGDLCAGQPGRGGDLQADPSRSDHQEPAGLADCVLEPFRIINAAQVEHAIGIGTVHWQGPGACAGGQKKLVIADAAAVRQLHLVRRPVHPFHPGAEQ
jgi:hypothetical protein